MGRGVDEFLRRGPGQIAVQGRIAADNRNRQGAGDCLSVGLGGTPLMKRIEFQFSAGACSFAKGVNEVLATARVHADSSDLELLQ